MKSEISIQSYMRDLNEFLAFSQGEFLSLKNSGKIEVTPRCVSCLSSAFFSDIRNGVCNKCSDSEHKKANVTSVQRESELLALDDLLRSAIGRGHHHYDALVMFSGGKDSTYLLHKLRSDYPGLRLLAVTIDSGFASPIAIENSRQVVARMDGVDSMIFRAKKSLFYSAFRHALTHLKPQTCYLTIDLLDGELTFDIGRNLAASMRIPLFIAGTSSAQIRLLHNLNHFERPREIMLSKRTHTTGGYDIEELSQAGDLHYWWDGTQWPEHQVPRNILPYHAWDYDESFVKEEVIRLGYLEPGYDNPLATNNILIPLMVNLDYARYGYCGFEPEFSLLVREGKASRDWWCNVFDAAAYLSESGRLFRDATAYALSKLDLSAEQVGLRYE
ncbi:MAG: hypothetical protein OEZ43_05535 [Gammaproteobacteria bacterium]|nr:hypothetical protein [Gammaproteobacteria bacterium]